MPSRIVFLLALLLRTYPARAADEISATIRQFAPGGAYSFGSDPVWLQVPSRRSVQLTAAAYGLVLVLCVAAAMVSTILTSRLGATAMSDPTAFVDNPSVF
jgi:hypothetical protein